MIVWVRVIRHDRLFGCLPLNFRHWRFDDVQVTCFVLITGIPMACTFSNCFTSLVVALSRLMVMLEIPLCCTHLAYFMDILFYI